MAPPCRVTVATAPQPGAVGLLQLHGPGAAVLAAALCDRPLPGAGRAGLRDLGGIDEGLAAALREDWGQLMPHGGPRVVQRLVERLVELGAVYETEPDARAMYPEAASPIEADALAATARAASPAAIDLLAAQPELWRTYARDPGPGPGTARLAGTLDRLLDPPGVVVVGRPNVGKSTLTNAMLGRAVSIVADLPGTTRDWVAGLAELTPRGGDPQQAVAVRWMDTPGLRISDDAIEQEAIGLARRVVESADVLIAMRDPAIDWPDPAALPREPDVWVVNKIDDRDPGGDGSRDRPLSISAKSGGGLDELQGLILAALQLDALDPPPRWAFSPTLRAWARGEHVDWRAYLGLQP